MKNKITIIVFVFMLAIAGIVSGAYLNNINVVSAAESQTIVSENIEMTTIENSTQVQIVGHYLNKEYCLRLTYTLTHLFPSDKLELRNGYAKYTYSDNLWDNLNNIDNDEYSIWGTDGYLNYVKSLDENEPLLFWFTDTCSFQDKYGKSYYFMATQYAVEVDDFEDGSEDSGEETSSTATYDRYGNYTFNGGETWIMPAGQKQVASQRIKAGSLDIDVELTDSGWRIVNTGTLTAKVKNNEGYKFLYYDYPSAKEYNLKKNLTFENTTDSTYSAGYQIKLSSTEFVGDKCVITSTSATFYSSDESKCIVYLSNDTNGIKAGWNIGVKTDTQNTSVALMSSVKYADTTNADISNYTFTNVSGAPTIELADDETSEFSQFLKANSLSLPSTGIMFENSNYTLPLIILGSMLMLTGVAILVLVKSKKHE